MLRCPYCHEDGLLGIACDACGAALHEECALAHGRCTSLGCKGSFVVATSQGKRGFHVPRPLFAELAQLPYALWAALGAGAVVLAAFQ